MQVRYLGHAAVVLTAGGGETLLIDPYEPGGFDGRMAYGPIPLEPDAVVCTHQHADHSSLESVPGTPFVIDEDGEFGPFSVHRHAFAHDEYEGRRFGGQVDVLEIRVDGYSLVHGADIGESPGAELPDGLKRADVAFVPVGGLYTVGAAQAWEWCRRLTPRLICPIHYATARCRLPLGSLESFLAHVPSYSMAAPTDVPHRVELPEGLPSFDTRVTVIEPEC